MRVHPEPCSWPNMLRSKRAVYAPYFATRQQRRPPRTRQIRYNRTTMRELPHSEHARVLSTFSSPALPIKRHIFDIVPSGPGGGGTACVDLCLRTRIICHSNWLQISDDNRSAKDVGARFIGPRHHENITKLSSSIAHKNFDSQLGKLLQTVR